MAQAAETAHIRPVSLTITPKARKRLTPFRERTFRAMYEAALADGGADVIEIAEVIYDGPIDGSFEWSLHLVCWIDGSHEDAMKMWRRVMDWRMSVWPSLSEAERRDWNRWISFDASPASMLVDPRASS